MTGRAAILARIADEVMTCGKLPLLWDVPGGCISLHAELYPQAPYEPLEIRFTAEWPEVRLTCCRSLAGYSLEGGLHRVHH